MNNSTLSYGICASKLTDQSTVVPVYLHSEIMHMKKKEGGETHVSCTISFIENLAQDKKNKLVDLIKAKRIGAIHIQEKEIKSLTLSEEALSILKKVNVVGVCFLNGDKISSLGNPPLMRAFASNDQYEKYVLRLL